MFFNDYIVEHAALFAVYQVFERGFDGGNERVKPCSYDVFHISCKLNIMLTMEEVERNKKAG